METEELKITDKNALIMKNVCSNCDRVLNVSPIFTMEVNNTMQKICGRCTHIVNNSKGKKLRQSMFEELAKYLTYPCTNKQYDCTAILTWENIVIHETVCIFQYTHCVLSPPFFPSNACNWVGNVRKLEDHIQNNHKDFIVQNNIQLSFDDLLENKIFFTSVSGKMITVIVLFREKNKYDCLLMINGNDIESQYQYQLELFTENDNKSIILRNNRLEKYEPLRESLKNTERLLNVNLDQIRNILGTAEHISGRFRIVKKNEKLVKQITGKEVASSKTKILDKSILQELECPVCNEYMVTRIPICFSGHSICRSCKARVQTCPLCRGDFLTTRNSTLEKFTDKVNFPCRNRDIGCSVVTTAETIRSHEARCELTETNCLLDCVFKCLIPKMYDHLLDKHSNLILDLEAVYKRNITESKKEYYAFYYNGELFRFNILTRKNCQFSLQHFGMAIDEPNYRYQLEFLDPSSKGRNFSLSLFCEPWSGVFEVSMDVPYDLMEPFLDGNIINYKISLFQV